MSTIHAVTYTPYFAYRFQVNRLRFKSEAAGGRTRNCPLMRHITNALMPPLASLASNTLPSTKGLLHLFMDY